AECGGAGDALPGPRPPALAHRVEPAEGAIAPAGREEGGNGRRYGRPLGSGAGVRVGRTVLAVLVVLRVVDMSLMRAYDEMIDFIAAGTRPQDLVAFRPSEATKQRVADLVARAKVSSLDPDEASELNHYLELEHFMRLAIARARRHLPHE